VSFYLGGVPSRSTYAARREAAGDRLEAGVTLRSAAAHPQVTVWTVTVSLFAVACHHASGSGVYGRTGGGIVGNIGPTELLIFIVIIAVIVGLVFLIRAIVRR
jgi:hypothetical protein